MVPAKIKNAKKEEVQDMEQNLLEHKLSGQAKPAWT